MKKVVAMASDNAYFKYMYVAIKSLMLHNSDVKIYIISIEEITEKNKQLVNELIKIYTSLEIQVVCLEDIFDGLLYPGHVSKTTYARLYIPTIVKEEKCLMLDVDIIVKKSLDELYSIDMEDLFLAGRRHLGYFLNGNNEMAVKKFGIPNFDYYINIGVMMMNVSLMRKYDIDKKLLEYIRGNILVEADQGVFNAVCYGKIGFIHPKYNWGESLRKHAKCYGEKCISEAMKEPVIIHYTDNKPWFSLYKWNANDWWNVARETTLYSEFCEEAVSHALKPSFPNVYSMDFKREFLRYIEEKNIIIYGAGTNGTNLLKMLSDRGIEPIAFAVSDKKMIYENQIEGVNVYDIDSLIDLKNNSLVIITIEDKKVKEFVKRKLEEYQFSYMELHKGYLI